MTCKKRWMNLIPFILLLQVDLSQCNKSITRQLHCSSELRIRNGVNPNGPDWFIVDEYVDLDRHRSSTKIFNVESERTKIFYNEVTSEGRDFIVFEESRSICKPSSVYDWSLAILRTLAMRMLPSSKFTSDLCDIAMGPSSLLLAISETLYKFRYVTKRFSDTRLTEIDVYERFLKSNDQIANQEKPLLVTLHVQSRESKVRPKFLGDTSDEIDVLSVLIVEIDEKIGLKRQKTKTKEEHIFDLDEVLSYIDYYIVTKLNPTTLIGQPLDRTGDFDFHRDPFVHPIGLGCWFQSDSGKESSRKTNFMAPSRQFSAIYTTNNSSMGSIFVAYSGYNDMLRIDNNGRKSIYELGKGLSYHVGEFIAMQEVTDSANHGKNCIALDIRDKRFAAEYMLERLLGVDSTSGNSGPYYMGSKLIEQISYQVYEKEIVFGRLESDVYSLPILLESIRFLMPTGNMAPTKRYFLTYYTTEQPNMPDLRSHVGTKASEFNDVALVPKYIELWELDKENLDESRKHLVNRLEFREFSWALDVEPNGDPDSRDLSHLFSIPSCAQERSTQLEIRFPVKQTLSGTLINKEVIAAFQANKQLIKEMVYENMAVQLDIPRINIAQVDVTFPSAKSADFVVLSRIIELPHSITVDTLLGYAPVSTLLSTLRDSVLSIQHNRHSMDDCKLDSLGERAKNAAVYCEGLTTCLLLKAEDASKFDQYQQKEEPELLRSNDFSKALCGVHLISWAQWAKTEVINRVFDNKYRIKSNLVIPFTYKKANEDSFQMAKFVGVESSNDVSVRSLDPVGLGGSVKSSLLGFRHSLVHEDNEAINLNYPVAMDGITKSEDKFKYCHFACQLDDYCESFSYCSRNKGARQLDTDCILSSMRLSREKINQLDTELKKIPTKESLAVVWDLGNGQAPVGSSETDRRVYKFKLDLACNLHPKDFISIFKLSHSIQLKKMESQATDDSGDDDDDATTTSLKCTIDECAAISHERAFESGSLDSNFTYCPLSAMCFPNQQQVVDGLTIEQPCHVYLKDATKFYHKRSHSRLVIKFADSPKLAISSTGSVKHDFSNANQLENLKLGRVIEVSNEKQCARECNLHQANCLSFDSCLSSGGLFCMLYSIRSPIENQRKLRYLPQEEQFYGDNNSLGQIKTKLPLAFTAESLNCDHFALTDLYFHIRLQQMAKKSQQDLTVEDKRQQSLQNKLNNLEEARLNEEEQIGDHILNNLMADVNELDTATSVRASSTSFGIHLLLLSASAFLGCMATLYGRQMMSYLHIVDRYERFKSEQSERRSREQRMSQIELARSLHL